jgi:quercetin dioxygenase-like cupin family protein
MRFSRIHADERGETHIGAFDLPEREGRIGPPPNPSGTLADVGPVSSMFVFSAPAGTEVPAHNAPQPYVCIVLSGEGEITTSDGSTLRLRPGDLVFCNDLHGKGHTTRILTDCTVAFVNRAGA